MKQWQTRLKHMFSRAGRTEAAEMHRKRNGILMLAFPILLVLLVEMNQLQSVTQLGQFLTGHFGVFLFDVCLVSALFLALLVLVQTAWIAAAGIGTIFFLLSCVEFFKFDVSGSHFQPQDLLLTGDLADVSGMAQLRMTAVLAIDILVFTACLLILFLSGARLRLHWPPRVGVAVGCLAAVLITVVTPASDAVFRLFGVDHRPSINTFEANAKFRSDNLIAFWCSELKQLAASHLDPPEPYDEAAVLSLLAETPETTQPSDRPNVLIVMSESYADFRAVDPTAADDRDYAAFDAFCADGLSGYAVVPTFGGYTGRSEFELLTGLPVASLADPIIPHDAVTRKTVEGIPELFRNRGYQTIYLHPYHSNFYDRESVYPKFGLDTFLFEDDLAIGNRTFHHRPEDAFCLEKTIDLLQQTEEPVFLFLTTMQNHQPYYYEAEQGVDELTYYLQGIAHTDEALAAFRQSLDTLDEDTIVLFIGDHFPFFGLPDNFYVRTGVDETNCAAYFRQHYFIYANYALDAETAAWNEVSLFYLPHLLTSLALGEDTPAISRAMLSYARQQPVYTTADPETDVSDDSFLDTLAYDRLIGQAWSAERELMIHSNSK